MRRVVTIDGPAGAGKSTVARHLAERLGWRFLDTGAMYRAVTLAALRAGIDLVDEAELERLVSRSASTCRRMPSLLDGRDVTHEIRSVEVTEASRYLADSPAVRRGPDGLAAGIRPRSRRRHRGARPGDAGLPRRLPQVLPHRHATRNEPGADWPIIGRRATAIGVSFESVLRDIRERDARDAARAIAPMKPAGDAIVVDSTGLSIEEVLTRLAEDIRPRSIGNAPDLRRPIRRRSPRERADSRRRRADGIFVRLHGSRIPA